MFYNIPSMTLHYIIVYYMSPVRPPGTEMPFTRRIFRKLSSSGESV